MTQGLQPGFLGLAVVDPDAHAPLFPLERAERVMAHTLERALRDGVVGAQDHQGLFRLQSYWAIKEGGLYMTMLLVANRHHDVLAALVPKTWGTFHLGAIPWNRFPPDLADTARRHLGQAEGPLVARGGLELASAHQALAWRMWCHHHARTDQDEKRAAGVDR
jgi:hypothetical protein